MPSDRLVVTFAKPYQLSHMAIDLLDKRYASSSEVALTCEVSEPEGIIS